MVFFPPPDPPSDKSSKQGTDAPDWVVLALLWLYAATPLGLCHGYLPPRFKPLWLYHVALNSIFATWIGLGIVQVVFNGQELTGLVAGVIAILVGIGGLGCVLLKSGSDCRQASRHPIIKR